MSTRIMGLCWPLQMRGPAKAVLIALADMANDEGFCWPSIDRLCERTCYGRTAVIDAIAWLESAGAVRANRTNGRHTTYWVDPVGFVGVDASSDVDNSPDQSAARTGTPGGPVRHADGTSPPRGPVPVRRADTNRHGIVKEPSIPPTPPADAGGERACGKDPKPDAPAVERGAAATADPASVDQVGDGFDALWRIYPRQQAEARARRQWRTLNPDAKLRRRIMGAVRAQLPDFQRLMRQGTPHLVPMLSAWLRGERWLDKVAPAAQAATWDATRSGIEGRGAKLGLGRWDQAAFDRGEGEPFLAYEARVRQRVAEQEEAECSSV